MPVVEVVEAATPTALGHGEVGGAITLRLAESAIEHPKTY
jgi:hypothetical protein